MQILKPGRMSGQFLRALDRCSNLVRAASARSAAFGLIAATSIASLSLPGAAVAQQLQRTFINLGFEQPNMGVAGCRLYIAEAQVPGWTTNHPSDATENVGCTGFSLNPNRGALIETWKTPRQGVNAREGTQLAELNAKQLSRISQNVCLVQGETVGWRFSHRGRGSATTHDVMNFLVGSQVIKRVQTTNTGAGGLVGSVAGQGTATSAAGPDGWRDYSGAFAYTGATGTTNLGFEAVSSAGGATEGNFLDSIQVELRSFVDFTDAQFKTQEGETVDLPAVRILGTVPAGGMNVLVDVTGGTATLGTDYQTVPANSTSLVVHIPAGNYDGDEFPITVSALADAIVEGDETVTFQIRPSPDDYFVLSTESCGAPAHAQAVWTITDAIPGLTILKTGTLNDLDGDGLLDLGETISYSFLVTNTGTVTLTGVTVTDPLVTIVEAPQTLAPGASFTFTANYTPVQADIDAGSVTNTATATGTPPPGLTPPVSPPSTAVVPPQQTPALTILKTGTLNDLDGDGLLDLGETISYAFLVTNTGTVTLTGVTVTDPLVTIVEAPQTLAPGASFTFTANYTPLQADIDAGSVTNTATATGTPPPGLTPPTSPPSTAVVPPQQTPALTILKTGTLNDLDGDGLLDLGETIAYAFLVTNTGTVTLTGVTVTDPLVTIVEAPQTLAPGASFTFTASYTPLQADIDAGQVTNTATATGTPPPGLTPPVSPPSTVVVPPQQTPGLTLVKTGTLNDLDGDNLLDLGETIAYEFLVTNTGNVTLTGVTVADPLVTIVEAPQTLAPGASFTFTASYTPLQADIDAGSVTNTATASGTPPPGLTPPVSPPSTAVVPPQQTPGLTLVKTGTLNDLDGDNLLDLGETIAYAFLVTNTGTVTLTGVTVTDPLVTIVEAPQTLAPGASFTFTASYTPLQADIDAGSVTNTATATGTPPPGLTPPVSPPSTVVVPPQQTPGLTLVKTGTLNDLDGDNLLDLGETIAYAFLVTNTGTVTLTGVTVTDPLVTIVEAPQTLAPGASFTFTASYTPLQADIDAGQVTNTATATGTPPPGLTPPVSPPSTVVVPPQQTPGLTLVKTGTLNDLDGDNLLDLGETIAYAFLVTNTGTVTLTGVTVTDPLVTIVEAPQTLAPGASFTFTASYTPLQADIDAGQVTNTATATGTPPPGLTPPVSPPSTAVVPPQQTPALTILKTGTLNDLDGDNLLDLGETIAYEFLVTNTGTVTLTGVTVSDPLVTINEAPQTLAPGASFTFTASYTPLQADIDAGSVTNTATASGTPPPGLTPPVSPPSTVVVPPQQTPGLTLVKTGTLNDLDGDNLLDLGETIAYAFLVTNTGTVTLTGVTVTDPLVTIVEAPQTLAPGASFTFTASYTPLQADIDAGSVTNTATASGTPPPGLTPPVSPPSTVTTPTDPVPAVSVTKRLTGESIAADGVAQPGEVLAYTITLTNSGGGAFNGFDFTEQVPQGATLTAVSGASGFHGPVAGPAQLGLTVASVPVRGSVTVAVEFIVDDPLPASVTAITNIVSGGDIGPDCNDCAVSVPVQAPSDLTVTKQAGLRYVRIGEKTPYTITVTNNAAKASYGITVTDLMPAGFRFVEGSASVDGASVSPAVNGRRVSFRDLSVAGGGELVIRLQLVALSSAGPGKHVNTAVVTDGGGNPLTPDGTATVEIVADPVFDCGEIIGKVFDDKNRNGYQDDGEPGLPGVRVATVKGVLVTTDKHGRFHVACADLPDQRIGSNFIMKLDTRTLPTGYRLTTENPRVVRLTAGKMTKLNFGASIGRVVRLDLKDDAFEPGDVTLKTRWNEGIDQLIDVLRKEQSVLRLSYVDAGADPALAHERLQQVGDLIRKKWGERRGQYRLEIETRVEVSQ
ncbi:DUF7507 domain-containing protein [Arvimicrobium flavum]|uniref:DUF7507 domain-containing protein n=1 Tax=Arvimicrobium flavum TaxID=3393320 RepID=UPI00237A1D1D|nr:hypothetical protein [Mesorhizobium shangrilense]